MIYRFDIEVECEECGPDVLQTQPFSARMDFDPNPMRIEPMIMACSFMMSVVAQKSGAGYEKMLEALNCMAMKCRNKNLEK